MSKKSNTAEKLGRRSATGQEVSPSLLEVIFSFSFPFVVQREVESSMCSDADVVFSRGFTR